MNIKRGIERIAIILALIALIPGFWGGWNTYKDIKTVKVRWYGDKKIPAKTILTPEEFDRELEERLSTRVEYHYPPDWQCVIAGVAGSSIAFLIVFFGISGLTRVSLWIVEGFKEQSG